MGSVNVWQPPMGAGCWLPAVERVAKDSPSPTRRPSSTNNLLPAEPYLCTMGDFRFQKKERLTKKKAIEELFQRGTSFSFFPLKVIFIANSSDDQQGHQVLITVPSRTFKKAVDRNTLKRRIREGYRLNKAALITSSKFSLAYIYIAKEILPSTTIHQAIQSSLKRVNKYAAEN